jgi:hypothetical protein
MVDFERGQKSGCDLAFFSVVASSPNLSTFLYATKVLKLFYIAKLIY